MPVDLVLRPKHVIWQSYKFLNKKIPNSTRYMKISEGAIFGTIGQQSKPCFHRELGIQYGQSLLNICNFAK